MKRIGVGKENTRSKEGHANQRRQAHYWKNGKGYEAILGITLHSSQRHETS